MWTRIWAVGLVILSIIWSGHCDEEGDKQLEKERIIAWAEKEGLTAPILNEEGLPILEVERINYGKLREYNEKCELGSPQKRDGEECGLLRGQIIKTLEEMDMDTLVDYLGKRMKLKEESLLPIKDEL